MIEGKLQQVRHDMESPVEKQHIYHGHYQTLGVGICAPGSDGYFPSCDAGFSTHCCDTAVYVNSGCLPAPQARAREVTHIVAEFCTIETSACEL